MWQLIACAPTLSRAILSIQRLPCQPILCWNLRISKGKEAERLQHSRLSLVFPEHLLSKLLVVTAALETCALGPAHVIEFLDYRAD